MSNTIIITTAPNEGNILVTDEQLAQMKYEADKLHRRYEELRANADDLQRQADEEGDEEEKAALQEAADEADSEAEAADEEMTEAYFGIEEAEAVRALIRQPFTIDAGGFPLQVMPLRWELHETPQLKPSKTYISGDWQCWESLECKGDWFLRRAGDDENNYFDSLGEAQDYAAETVARERLSSAGPVLMDFAKSVARIAGDASEAPERRLELLAELAEAALAKATGDAA